MQKSFYFYIVLILLFAMLSCEQAEQHHDANNHAHHEHMHSFTKWSDNYELFAEVQPIIAGHETEAVIHLTHLSDHSPVTKGNVELVFLDQDSIVGRFHFDQLSRPGIFSGHFRFERTGEWLLKIVYKTSSKISFLCGNVHSFSSKKKAEEHLHAHERKESKTHDIHLATFLKEQQWKIAFSTQNVQKITISDAVLAFAQVVPHQRGYADVVAPVNGLLGVEHNQTMAVPGDKVRKGDELLVLCPPIGMSNTFLDRRLSFQRAKRDFERAQNLLQRDAISRREYEEIKQTFLLEKSNYENLMQNYNADATGDTSACLVVRAPVNGIVAEVAVLPGQRVAAGDDLLTVIDLSTVWVRAQIYEKDIDRIGQVTRLSVLVHGKDEKIVYNPTEFDVLSRGPMLDSKTRTLPFIFEVTNTNNRLKIGQVLQTEIHTSRDKKMLAVPKSAVMDTDIEKFVFVQKTGEQFERRTVQTGPISGEWIAIEKGLQADERIVTKGAYALKLANANEATGHAHLH